MKKTLTPPNREERIRFARQTQFDLAIIGGGIIGAGVARDAALRGLRVALLEKNDFGCGTTAGSTRLIHGGLRYLEMLDFRLVRLDLREREILLRIASHLVRPLEFYFPFYHNRWIYRAKMRAGMWLYDLLSFDKTLPRHRILSARELCQLEPELSSEGLQGAAVYFDAQVNLPERLCLENLLDARENGALIFNYAEVTGRLMSGGKMGGIKFRDVLGGGPQEYELRSHLTLNAAGPWLDPLNLKFQDHTPPRLRITKGIHLACAPLNRHAMALFAAVDGRLVFIIPWLGYSWIGTTDTDYSGDPAMASATPEDVRYLLDSLQPYFPALRETSIYFTNAGVRSLVMEKGSASAVSRMHKIVDETRNGLPGLISILGGKITGYRSIAEEATNLVARKLGCRVSCGTSQLPLPGAFPDSSDSAELSTRLPSGTWQHLCALYGTRARNIAALIHDNQEWEKPLDPAYPDIAAQVIFAVREEECRRLADFILRRTMLGFTTDQGSRALAAAAHWMAGELGWSAFRVAGEIEHCHQEIEKTQKFR